MSHPHSISVVGLGKRFRLGERAPMRRLRQRITYEAQRPVRYVLRRTPPQPTVGSQTVWALDDISFNVRQGEVLGVIGRNGAGKTTLLRILAGITVPTVGMATVKGNAGSLLAVGTGFHPELTGRENVFMNGAILGMSRSEVRRKFDEIVAFAGVADFVDTPVKRYSSGMSVRLAFAVAAHLDTEVLFVDEVLAVGDAAFQERSRGRLDAASKEGRTILFVSHNMTAIRALTTRCIHLESGRIVADGDPESVVAGYLRGSLEARYAEDLDTFRRDATSDEASVRFGRVDIAGSEGVVPTFDVGDAICIRAELTCARRVPNALVSFRLKKEDGTLVTEIFSADEGLELELTPGTHSLTCDLGEVPFAPGRYYVDAGVNENPTSRSSDVLLDLPLFSIREPAHGGSLAWPNRAWGAVHWRARRWGLDD